MIKKDQGLTEILVFGKKGEAVVTPKVPVAKGDCLDGGDGARAAQCRDAALMVNALLTIPFKLPGQTNVIFDIFP